MTQLIDWIWLTTLSGVSTQSQLRLLEHFGSPAAVRQADPEELRTVEGLRRSELGALRSRDLGRAERVLEDCRNMGYHILTMEDTTYPQRLQYIEGPPLVLYYVGELLPFDELPVIAVVGARNSSRYGQNQAYRLGYELAGCGGTVLTGIARGIDSRALEGALRAGSKVAAVLGNGLDVVYPAENGKLYEAVRNHGCLISEYTPGTPPYGKNFPKRNRIMSGLALATLVVEAGERSGSLITANLALEQGRDVYAVPGNLEEACCMGSNALLQDGALLATSGWDVLQNYQARYPSLLRRFAGKTVQAPYETPPVKNRGRQGPQQEKSGQIPSNPEKRIDNAEKTNYIDLQQVSESLSQEEKTVAGLLQDGKMHVDELIAESELPAAKVLSVLTMLEVKGYVTRHSGSFFTSNLT